MSEANIVAGEVVSVLPPRQLRIRFHCNGEELIGTSLVTCFNAKEGRAFEIGDKVHVHVMDEKTNGVDEEVSVCLTKEYVRVLLVLDINGVLGARGPYQPKQHKRSFYPRPHLESFLSFCLSRFEVGVWSCALRKNIEVNIFPEDSLLFVWDSSNSTNLWPRRSVVSDAKPLFLKELSRIWSSFPCYSASNTILVDNHLEKFERNPMGTCLILPEYSVKHTGDDYLSNESELVRNLSQLCCCTDTSSYIRSHAGTSMLFPEQHQNFKAANAFAAPTTNQQNSKSKQSNNRDNGSKDSSGIWKRGEKIEIASDAFPGPPSSTPATSELLMHYLTLSWGHRVPIAKIHSEFVAKQTLPAPRAITLRRHQMNALRSEEMAVCEKTDGDRCVLVISAKYNTVYSVDRSLHIHVYPSAASSLPEGETVFDGEMVWNIALGCMMYMIFDAVVVNSSITGLTPNLYTRLTSAQQYILSLSSEFPLLVACKQLLPLGDIERVVANMKETDIGFLYSDHSGSSHASDGLLFTPAAKTYFDTLCYKWKPVHLTTIDFAVKVSDVSKIFHRTHFDNCSLTGYSLSGHNMVPICTIQLHAHDTQLLSDLRCSLNNSRKEEYRIVECSFVKGVWYVFKYRPERVSPNSIRTAWNNLECISENLHLEELLSFACTSSAFAQADDVARHYDRLQIGRNRGEVGGDARIAVLRRLNNWAKACMIRHITSGDSGRINVLYDVLESTSTVSVDPTVLTTASPSRRFKQQSFPQVKVADIGCGRGGDLNKWTSSTRVTLYFGIDPSQGIIVNTLSVLIKIESITEAKKRAAELHKRRKQNLQYFEFHVMSATDDAVSVQLECDIKKRFPSHIAAVDVMWCQFALVFDSVYTRLLMCTALFLFIAFKPDECFASNISSSQERWNLLLHISQPSYGAATP